MIERAPHARLSLRSPAILLGAALLALLPSSGCFPEVDPNASATGGTPSVIEKGGTGGHRARGGSANRSGGTGGAASEVGGTGGDSYTDPYPDDTEPQAGMTGSAGEPAVVPTGACLPPRSSWDMPARGVVVSASLQPAYVNVFTSQIWDQFRAHCGACHVDANYGSFKVTPGTFASLVDQKVIDIIKSSDPLKAMPQGPEGGGTGKGKPYTDRDQTGATDAVVRLVQLLELWIDAGSPPDVIRVPNTSASDQSPYLLPPDLGAHFSNLGTCVPAADHPIDSMQNFPFGWEHEKMDQLDALFEKAEANPDADTGNEQLGLPALLSQSDLFTLDSEVLARHGVAAFVPGYPLWSDGSGKLRYVRVPRGKSIVFDKDAQEFRIPPNTRFYKTFLKEVIDDSGEKRFRKIETRLIVSRPNLDANGTIGALFGTYKWDEDESEARLVVDPQNDGRAFTDVVFPYPTDQPQTAAVEAEKPHNLAYALQGAGVLRHYGIPGAERCRQCHVGSVRDDFVLGFTPLQIWRRKQGEGGTIEATGDDELDQLDRLIRLGVITGLASSDDIVPLEKSQLPRTPRNTYELQAQGYVFGNCGHCHNPHGYASRSAPQLTDILKFWPAKDGGIFGFPLNGDKAFSPRISRGAQGRQIPYITPSLRDLVPYDFKRVPWTPKTLSDASFEDAPWRSLIYRNTQTPFTYAEDYTIFPHMPLNTGGYDCRASQLLGKWMVSIPARLKASVADLSEDEMDFVGGNQYPGAPNVINESQPYEEVLSTDKDYAEAKHSADDRLRAFMSGTRYKTCAASEDILDPYIVAGVNTSGVPSDTDAPKDGVPDHTHWVVTDLTQPPVVGWDPRRDDWKAIFDGGASPIDPSDPNRNTKLADEKALIGVLKTMKLGGPSSDFYQFLTTPFPLGLWKTASDCNFSQVKRAKDYTGDERPRWLDVDKADADAPVFTKLPGGAVYDMICINCHGPRMDSLGRQAETVLLLSGGTTHVANFTTGLFGPTDNPGTNRAAEFAKAATSDVTTDDWGARYMAWMALGGTLKTIPTPVLQLVGRTDVAGTARRGVLIDAADVTANMLAAAKSACGQLYAAQLIDYSPTNSFGVDPTDTLSALIETNGDFELWQKLCTFGNAPPVIGIDFRPSSGEAFFSSFYLLLEDQYPATARVGNHRGKLVTGLVNNLAGEVDNYRPWCVVPGDAAASFAHEHAIDGEDLPLCPDEVMDPSQRWPGTPQATNWQLHGAANAGFAVFAYLDQVTHGRVKPIRYDECQLLSQ